MQVWIKNFLFNKDEEAIELINFYENYYDY